MKSPDGERTWTEPVELVPGDEGGRGPVRAKPIRLSDGAWLAGASTELGSWRPFADRSEDRGEAWTHKRRLQEGSAGLHRQGRDSADALTETRGD